VGTDGAGGTARQRDRQRCHEQHQQHGNNVACGVETKVDNVKMTTGNEYLMHLITNRADDAEERDEKAPEASAQEVLAQAGSSNRRKQADEEKLDRMGDATDVGCHPHTNRRERIRANAVRLVCNLGGASRPGLPRITGLRTGCLPLHHVRR